MAKNIECEKRVMLSKVQYTTLRKHYLKTQKINKLVKQENVYFDDQIGSIEKKKAILRIRNKKTMGKGKHDCEITFKFHSEEGSIEINQDISIKEYKSFKKKAILPEGEVKEEIQKQIPELGCLAIIGELTTARYSFHSDNCLIELDKNKYEGIKDYNLEVEAINLETANNKILEICDEFNIVYTTEYVTKSNRAINKRRGR